MGLSRSKVGLKSFTAAWSSNRQVRIAKVVFASIEAASIQSHQNECFAVITSTADQISLSNPMLAFLALKLNHSRYAAKPTEKSKWITDTLQG